MSRVSYEIASNTLVLIAEGENRNRFYYLEQSLCTISTDTTISSMVQKFINQKNGEVRQPESIYDKLNSSDMIYYMKLCRKKDIQSWRQNDNHIG